MRSKLRFCVFGLVIIVVCITFRQFRVATNVNADYGSAEKEISNEQHTTPRQLAVCNMSDEGAAAPSMNRSLIQAPPAELPPLRSECIVVVTRFLEACRMKRLRALLHTSGDHRPVYVLHDRSYTMSAFVLLDGRLHAVPQPEVSDTWGWRSFGGETSGLAKPSFLLWAAQNLKNYEYVWHLEDDIFYTGRWHTFFDYFSKNNASVLTAYEKSDMSGVDAGLRLSHCCVRFEQPCSLRLDTKVFWPLVRLSRHVISELAFALNNGARGHHEVLLAAFCHAHDWCRLEGFPSSLIGLYELGNWGEFTCCCTLENIVKKMEKRHGKAVEESNKIFHPVKCDLRLCGHPASGDYAIRWAALSHRLFDFDRDSDTGEPDADYEA